MFKSIFTNWKTTLLGIGAAALNQAQNGTSWKTIGLSSILLLLGALAKDFNVTGGTVPNSN